MTRSAPSPESASDQAPQTPRERRPAQHAHRRTLSEAARTLGDSQARLAWLPVLELLLQASRQEIRETRQAAGLELAPAAEKFTDAHPLTGRGWAMSASRLSRRELYNDEFGSLDLRSFFTLLHVYGNDVLAFVSRVQARLHALLRQRLAEQPDDHFQQIAEQISGVLTEEGQELDAQASAVVQALPIEAKRQALLVLVALQQAHAGLLPRGGAVAMTPSATIAEASGVVAAGVSESEDDQQDDQQREWLPGGLPATQIGALVAPPPLSAQGRRAQYARVEDEFNRALAEADQQQTPSPTRRSPSRRRARRSDQHKQHGHSELQDEQKIG